jgi:hypothetical protein
MPRAELEVIGPWVSLYMFNDDFSVTNEGEKVNDDEFERIWKERL